MITILYDVVNIYIQARFMYNREDKIVNRGTYMKELDVILADLHLEQNIQWDDIPNIDLYMDQVIQLFENTYSGSKRNEKEKILTKTMINNYAKGKLFFPINKKKYSKEHIILISLIYQLKGALSMNDIKATLHSINEKVLTEELQLDKFYNSYLNLYNQNANKFRDEIKAREKEVKAEVACLDNNHPEELEKTLLIASLVNTSNMYRRAAEKLIDE